MRILLIYKLATKQIGIKNQSKGTNNPKPRRLYKNLKNFIEKVQRGHMTPLTPKSLNVLIEGDEPQPHKKTQNTIKYTRKLNRHKYVRTKVKIQSTTSPNQL